MSTPNSAHVSSDERHVQASELEGRSGSYACSPTQQGRLAGPSGVTATGFELQSPRGETVARRLAEQACDHHAPGGFSPPDKAAQRSAISHARHQQNLSKAEEIGGRDLVQELLGLRERANRANTEHVLWQHTAPHFAVPFQLLPPSRDGTPAVSRGGGGEGELFNHWEAEADKENREAVGPDARARNSPSPAERLPLSLAFPLPRYMYYSQKKNPAGAERESQVRTPQRANEEQDEAAALGAGPTASGYYGSSAECSRAGRAGGEEWQGLEFCDRGEEAGAITRRPAPRPLPLSPS